MATHSVLVLLDTPTIEVRSAAKELLTLARNIGEPVAVAFEAPNEKTIEQLKEYGVRRLFLGTVEGGASHHLTPVAAELLAQAVEMTQARAVLASPTFENKEISARLAYAIGAGLVIDTVKVGLEGDNFVGYKRVFAGSWDVDCTIRTPIAVATVRANAVIPAPADTPSESLEIVEFSVAPSELATSAYMVSRTEHAPIAGGSGRPKLAEAAFVVAGGRGTNGDYGPVEELADALGGAVGATRDAVDEGWIEHDAQIGQTGVTVAPRVYIGAGISGAPHHRGGMQASGIIIGVNSDADAPIFEICDFGVVGELQDVLPQAAAAIRAYKEGQYEI
ncbi:electron transfer flavoprotein subunit alpha/FixB family protein [Timonella senegalensis]|uniref:electron transfer flavoprotein subunit alpha/FixB family protein n=1 Tax=Timonella senegalensis TaxID=1465825 RepID=UPI000309C709|nr:electron transfer flavoprotein subunit alpha/FixB family protein [Timonella senegalensis]